MNIKERKRKTYLRNKLLANNKCVVCGDIALEKYCSHNCRSKHKEILIFERIDNGDFILEEIKNEYAKSRWFKRYLITKHGEKCMQCGWDKKHLITNKVPIELEHNDGNSENNNLKNLKLLCPNCHSLTLTYKNLNKGKGRKNRYKHL